MVSSPSIALLSKGSQAATPEVKQGTGKLMSDNVQLTMAVKQNIS